MRRTAALALLALAPILGVGLLPDAATSATTAISLSACQFASPSHVSSRNGGRLEEEEEGRTLNFPPRPMFADCKSKRGSEMESNWTEDEYIQVEINGRWNRLGKNHEYFENPRLQG